MPNMIAWGVLFGWPVVTAVLFLTLKPQQAIIWSLLGGYLLLPVNVAYDPPGLPAFDKTSIPNIATLICALLFAKGRVVRLPDSKAVLLLMALFIASPFLTTFSNQAPIILSQTAIPGMTIYDGMSLSFGNIFTLIPLVLGYSVLSREGGHLEMLKILVISALLYSVLILYELRFSPVLHHKIYGIAPFSDFSQFIRFGGYRPAVFLGHGLLISIFYSMALTASVILWRLRVRVFGLPPIGVVLYLIVLLILIKSVGAIILAIFGLAILLFFRPRRMVTIMFALALVIVTYPLIRATGLVPMNSALSLANGISTDRAQSLEFRFKNEDILLDRANLKPLVGWGSWGRNQVYQMTGWGTDMKLSTVDGMWVIVIGQYGWIGYISMFGLLCYPFWHAFRERRGVLGFATLGLLLVLMLNLMDLIPNASIRPITWLITGALSGVVAGKLGRTPVRKPDPF